MQPVSSPDSGIPNTTPAYDPQNAKVANLDLSSGGAQYLQIPWQAGYVTPWPIGRNNRKKNNKKREKCVGK